MEHRHFKMPLSHCFPISGEQERSDFVLSLGIFHGKREHTSRDLAYHTHRENTLPKKNNRRIWRHWRPSARVTRHECGNRASWMKHAKGSSGCNLSVCAPKRRHGARQGYRVGRRPGACHVGLDRLGNIRQGWVFWGGGVPWKVTLCAVFLCTHTVGAGVAPFTRERVDSLPPS